MAGYTDSSLDDALNGQAAAATRISFHTADPGTTGANEVAGSRPATTWGAAEATAAPDPVPGRRRVGSQVTQTIPAGATVTHWGLWTAATAGTFKGGWPLDAPEAFGSQGQIQHTPRLIQTN